MLELYVNVCVTVFYIMCNKLLLIVVVVVVVVVVVIVVAKVTSCARGDTICLRPLQVDIYSPGGTCSGMLAI